MTSQRQLQIGEFQSDLLDLSRWLAAFLVVAEHARSFIFRPYADEPQAGVLGKAFYFLTGFGHSSVMVFFVMSGFLVGGKILERLTQGTFSWKKYVIDRSSRLYAVYFVALILGGLLDYSGYHYLNQFGLYDESFSGRIAVVNFNFHQNLSIPILAVNLAMCQTILGPVFGSNGPLWSLANEFWYYLAGPLLFGMFFTCVRWRLLVGVAALAVLLWFLPAEILIYFLVWLLGALLYFVNARSLLPFWCSLPLFLACFSAARLQWLQAPFLADLLIGISFALVINSVANCICRLPGHALSRKAADFSYSVYLCHFPFLVIVLSALYRTTGVGLQSSPSTQHASLFLFILFLTYLWCYGVSLFTERQTPRIREWLYRLLPEVKTIP